LRGTTGAVDLVIEDNVSDGFGVVAHDVTVVIATSLNGKSRRLRSHGQG